MSRLTKEVVHAIWEDHVRSKDEVIECAERVLEPLLLAGTAMRNCLFGASLTVQEAGRMWDDAIREVRERQ